MGCLHVFVLVFCVLQANGYRNPIFDRVFGSDAPLTQKFFGGQSWNVPECDDWELEQVKIAQQKDFERENRARQDFLRKQQQLWGPLSQFVKKERVNPPLVVPVVTYPYPQIIQEEYVRRGPFVVTEEIVRPPTLQIVSTPVQYVTKPINGKYVKQALDNFPKFVPNKQELPNMLPIFEAQPFKVVPSSVYVNQAVSSIHKLLPYQTVNTAPSRVITPIYKPSPAPSTVYVNPGIVPIRKVWPQSSVVTAAPPTVYVNQAIGTIHKLLPHNTTATTAPPSVYINQAIGSIHRLLPHNITTTTAPPAIYINQAISSIHKLLPHTTTTTTTAPPAVYIDEAINTTPQPTTTARSTVNTAPSTTTASPLVESAQIFNSLPKFDKADVFKNEIDIRNGNLINDLIRKQQQQTTQNQDPFKLANDINKNAIMNTVLPNVQNQKAVYFEAFKQANDLNKAAIVNQVLPNLTTTTAKPGNFNGFKPLPLLQKIGTTTTETPIINFIPPNTDKRYKFLENYYGKPMPPKQSKTATIELEKSPERRVLVKIRPLKTPEPSKRQIRGSMTFDVDEDQLQSLELDLDYDSMAYFPAENSRRKRQVFLSKKPEILYFPSSGQVIRTFETQLPTQQWIKPVARSIAQLPLSQHSIYMIKSKQLTDSYGQPLPKDKPISPKPY